MGDYTTVVSLPARRDADPMPGAWGRDSVYTEALDRVDVDFRHSETANPQRTRLLVSVRVYGQPSPTEVNIYNVTRVHFVPLIQNAVWTNFWRMRLYIMPDTGREQPPSDVERLNDSFSRLNLADTDREQLLDDHELFVNGDDHDPRGGLLIFDNDAVFNQYFRLQLQRFRWHFVQYFPRGEWVPRYFWETAPFGTPHLLAPEPVYQPPHVWIDDPEVNAELDDISDLYADAQAEATENPDSADAGKIEAWRCSICHEGIVSDDGSPGDCKLVAAHQDQATDNADGPQTLHVFHRRCLDEWKNNSHLQSDDTKLCPLCRRDLSMQPLPAVWRPGLTNLGARMRTNVYLVTQADTAMPESQAGFRDTPLNDTLLLDRKRVLSFRSTLTGLALEHSFVSNTNVQHLRSYFDVNTRETGVSGARPSDRFVVDPMCFTLRDLLNVSFNLDETDRVNLSKSEWLHLSFDFGQVRRNKDRAGLPDGFQAWFRSTDTKHRIVVVLPDPKPATSESDVLMIEYTGFLHFKLYETPAGRCQRVRLSVPASANSR
jgi:hypothetical protein